MPDLSHSIRRALRPTYSQGRNELTGYEARELTRRAGSSTLANRQLRDLQHRVRRGDVYAHPSARRELRSHLNFYRPGRYEPLPPRPRYRDHYRHDYRRHEPLHCHNNGGERLRDTVVGGVIGGVLGGIIAGDDGAAVGAIIGGAAGATHDCR